MITKSSVLNEPGHTKVVEETTKTTYITSTSIVNEELHLVETSTQSSKDEGMSNVKKTVVEVKGSEEHKTRSRSSSSSSSSSEDECEKNEEIKDNVVPSVVNVADHAQIENTVVVDDKESEIESEAAQEIMNEKEDDHVSSSSSSSDDECEKKLEEPKSDNETAVESPEEKAETSNEMGEEEEIESKRKASLIQAEVKVVPEPSEVQEETKDSSSSSSSSSDSEEEEESTKEESMKVSEDVDIASAKDEEEIDQSNEPVLEGNS